MAFDWFMLRSGAERTFEFRCAACGEIHGGSPSFGYDRPHFYFSIPEDERSERVSVDDDTCVIDGEIFLIRTVLEIPIIGATEPFTWGVWVSQSEDSFNRYVETFDQDQSSDSSFGWLTVTLPGYISSESANKSLGCEVLWGGDGQRPNLLLHETDHALYFDQRDGISWERAIELARLTMHGE